VPGSPEARFLLAEKATVTNRLPDDMLQVKEVANPVPPVHVGEEMLIVEGGVILKRSPATNLEVVVNAHV
jgi:hypothetical protein